MISIRKLDTLPKRTRLRKIVLLLRDQEIAERPDDHYLSKLCGILIADASLPDEVRLLAGQPLPDSRSINRLRHALLRHLGQAPGDWDFWDERTARLDSTKRTVLDFALFIEEVRSPFNVGAIFRVAESFGIGQIFVSPYSALPTHRRALRSAMGAVEAIPWQLATLQQAIEQWGEAGIFALETGGEGTKVFDFPTCGLVMIGSEELGMSAEALACAKRSAGVVSIATAGAKASLNVAVAFGIMMHAWFHAKASHYTYIP